MKKIDMGVGLFGVVFGGVVIWLIRLTNLKVNTKIGLGSGFMPLVCAVLIIVCGLAIFLAALLKRPDPDDPEKKEDKKVSKPEAVRFAVVCACGCFVCLTARYIGLISALGIVVAAMAKLLGDVPWLKSILLGAGSALAYWLIFGVILNVPLPTGLLGF